METKVGILLGCKNKSETNKNIRQGGDCTMSCQGSFIYFHTPSYSKILSLSDELMTYKPYLQVLKFYVAC